MGYQLSDDYVTVAERIIEFREKYPNGSLQPWNPAEPYRIETINGNQCFVVVAAAYRDHLDDRPGIGMAYEPVPGSTPYTRGSELQNAETAAWGRAIVAALAADTKKGIASREEVQVQIEAQNRPVTSTPADTPNLTGYESWFDAIEERRKLPDAYDQLVNLHGEGVKLKVPKAVLDAIEKVGREVKARTAKEK